MLSFYSPLPPTQCVSRFMVCEWSILPQRLPAGNCVPPKALHPDSTAARQALSLLGSHVELSVYMVYTRSQAVARIDDRIASQHLWGHVTSSVT